MGTRWQELTRRDFVANSGSLVLSVAVAMAGFKNTATAADLTAVDVAYAGSMSSLMEGPVKATTAQTLKLDFHGRGQ